MSADTYFIRPDYVARAQPEYYHDDDAGPDDADGVVWQPDVYTYAADVARVVGARRIVDLGCGSGKKLVALAGQFDVVGVDYGGNIAQCRQRHAAGRWIEFDLSDRTGWVPLAPEDLAGAVVVSSDVIEHLAEPEHLLRQLGRCLEHAAALVVSTPDRERVYGPRHLGPPKNPAHVREWTAEEFAALLRASGFAHVDVRMTRSSTETWDLQTILATVYRDAETASRVRAAGVRVPQPPPPSWGRRVRSWAAAVPGARVLRRALSGAR